MSKWSMWKNKTYMELLFILLTDSFFTRWLFWIKLDTELVNNGGNNKW